MLQQTQVATVIPYYERWLKRFPTVEALANAPLDDVLKLWEGLGYYSRARNLHAAAQVVAAEFDGRLPQTAKELQKLKGIGPYTGGAIASIAFDQPAPVLDGNVIRVLTRLFDISDDITQTASKKRLWQLAGELVPDERPGDYNQALMELGQRVCQPTAPKCGVCPVAVLCLGRQRGTQFERPVRPPRKRTPHYDVIGAIVCREDGRFLLARRPIDGLLGGLWGIPHGRVNSAGENHATTLVRIMRDQHGLIVQPNPNLLTKVNHAYTHFRITLHVYRASLLQQHQSTNALDNLAWIIGDESSNYALAKTDRTILQTLSETLIC